MIGIDVHGSKGPIDWRSVRAHGVDFAFVKASEGRSFIDKRTALNVEGARANGILVGCYHFARPNANSPEREADNFLRRINGLGYTLPPVLDIEDGDGDLSTWARTFCQHVEFVTGHTPIIYTYSAFAHHLTHASLGGYPLWLAAYRNTPPTAPRPWNSWTIWQHTSDGTVPGVPGRCDMNKANRLPTIATGEDEVTTPAQITEIVDRTVKGVLAALIDPEVLAAERIRRATRAAEKLAEHFDVDVT